MDRTPLSPSEIRAVLDRLPDWRPRLGALHAAFRLSTVAAAVDLLGRLGALAEEVDHHPDVDWRQRVLFVSTTTLSAGRVVTAADVELARRTSVLAAQAGASAEPALSRSLEIAVDTADPAPLRGAWAAALGYRDDERRDELVDPWRRLPTVWFQVSPTPSVNRLHLDVSVAAETAADVLAAAQRAGGRLDDAHAPAFTVVTDTDGNRVCVCTPLGRDSPA